MPLVSRIDAFPRVPLGHFPTPLEPLPRLARALGGPSLWVKREDVTGPALGGNKTRKLEFLFGEARAKSAQTVATFGGLQSNFARQMCAGARSLGMEPHCFYFERRPRRLEGNLLLAQLLGGRLHFVPLARGGDASMTIERTSRLVRQVVRVTPGCAGRRTYFMPVGGHAPVACLGYVRAAIELDDQLRERGVERATIVTAAGTGGTLAGLLAGLRLLDSPHEVLGIDIGRLWRGFAGSVAALASETCELLGESTPLSAEDVPLLEDTYVGDGYARPTPESLAALRLAAREEGLILDPVYTSKAMAGLIDLVKRGRWQSGDHVVFLHTGGSPALWAYDAKSLTGES